MGYTDIADEELEVIKNDFLQKYRSSIEKGVYHPLDVERIKKDTCWVRAFYKHSQENSDKTVNMINEVLIWRKEFNANELLTPGKLPFPEELFNKGALFMKNEDINCIPMLHFVTKTHKKDQYPHAQICKFISYFFERVYKFNIDDPIVLLFDMTDAGYSNLDMEMIKFVVNCLKTYYPGLIDYMIIYQMPFIFNAAWKIIKNWLPPESVKLIKFVDKKSIKEYVQESQLFIHMGGTDPYKYVYDPKVMLVNKKVETVAFNREPISSFRSVNKINENINDVAIVTQMTAMSQAKSEADIQLVQKQKSLDLSLQENPKENTSSKVNFDLYTSTSTKVLDDIPENEKDDNNPRNSNVSKISNGYVNKIYDTSKASELSFENVLTTPLLSISPGDELVFQVGDGKSDITQHIKLTNTSGVLLAYKIKITSPDKFRVKPGTGIIETSSCAQIMINYLKEYHNSSSNHRDKFLILWTPLNEKINPNELNEFWKQAVQKKTNVHDHKVKCIVIRSKESKVNSPSTTASSPIFNSTNNSTAVPNTNPKSIKKQANTLGVEESVIIKNSNESTENSALAENSNHHTTKIHVDHEQLVLTKLIHIENNVKATMLTQQKLNKQYSIILFLIYFLILLNLIQILFQSNLFSQVVEPYIDYFLFQKKD